ncbi:MAG: hypothetical protein COA91_01585 [Robiginitomaculum sp.]|nr:MAG: hypothetical protein COA91_01585 [Robiginitomaculum sp.]
MFLSTDTISSFAVKRNDKTSFAYLKENGELLSIAASSGLLLEPAALEHYRSFYATALETCKFFPQYFRFILSIILDLEDLGYPGNTGTHICDFVRSQGYLDFETTDLRRLEILILLARRSTDGAIERKYRKQIIENVDKFISKPDHFVIYNKPLFYELTHFIFFLTNFGENIIPLKSPLIECLTNVGILALLDDDVDLLAETCICFKFLGKKPPAFWEHYVEESLSKVTVTFDTSVASAMNNATDEYHAYFMMNWLLALRKLPTFTERFNGRTPYFSLPQNKPTTLSVLSNKLYKTQIAKTISTQECVESLVNLSETNRRLLINTLDSTPQTATLLSKYSQGLFNNKSLSIV